MSSVSRDGGHKIHFQILLDSKNAATAAVGVVLEGLELARLFSQRLQILVVGFGQQHTEEATAGRCRGRDLSSPPPPGQVSKIAAINSNGFLFPRAGIWESLSAFWKSDSWCDATKRCLMSLYGISQGLLSTISATRRID